MGKGSGQAVVRRVWEGSGMHFEATFDPFFCCAHDFRMVTMKGKHRHVKCLRCRATAVYEGESLLEYDLGVELKRQEEA